MNLEEDFLDRIKDAAVYLNMTLNEMTTIALEGYLEHLEKTNGGPFPKRSSEPRRGRRIQ